MTSGGMVMSQVAKTPGKLISRSFYDMKKYLLPPSQHKYIC